MTILQHKNPIVVLGLGFGDEGKGATIDGLTRARSAELVIRFNGGSQAAHHVVTPERRVHCFSQFGSGTLVGARTYLSRFMVADPIALELEAEFLTRQGIQNPLNLVSVDDDAIITTPYHRLLGRARELARAAEGGSRHGSCGKGIGIAWLDRKLGKTSLTWGHLRHGGARKILTEIMEEKVEEIRQPYLLRYLDVEHKSWLETMDLTMLDKILARYHQVVQKTTPFEKEKLPHPSKVIFEGAQGALLDADLGFFPYVTPSHTGAQNALKLAKEFGWDDPFCLGILRSYSSRHGMGPLVVEDPELAPYLPEVHNKANPWQGPMRVGWFDAVASRYGIKVAGKVDGLMITHLDRMSGWPQIGVCDAWDTPTPPSDLPPEWQCAQASAALTDLPRLEGTLEQRTRWAAWVAQSRPLCQVRSGWSSKENSNLKTFLHWIESELERPISGVSFGPSALEQTWI